MRLPSGEIFGLNAVFHSSDWSIVGVVEAAAGAVFTGSCATAVTTSNQDAANTIGSKETLRIAPYLPFMTRNVNSGFAVPEDEHNEKTNSHNGEPQIDMPSVQHRRRCDRAQGRQCQQQGSPALSEFLLFDHSRFCSLLCGAHSPPHRRFFLALSSRQLAAQVHDLPYMMIRMPRTTQENLEAISSLRLALGSVRFSPVPRLLFSNRGHHHGDVAIKGSQFFFLCWCLLVHKLTVALADVTRFTTPSSPVFLQISG